MTTNVIEIEYVDFGAQGEYGLWGKVVARSIVTGWTPEEIEIEKAQMREILGDHVLTREVEIIPGTGELVPGTGDLA